jgi:hypothetical protein
MFPPRLWKKMWKAGQGDFRVSNPVVAKAWPGGFR